VLKAIKIPDIVSEILNDNTINSIALLSVLIDEDIEDLRSMLSGKILLGHVKSIKCFTEWCGTQDLIHYDWINDFFAEVWDDFLYEKGRKSKEKNVSKVKHDVEEEILLTLTHQISVWPRSSLISILIQHLLASLQTGNLSGVNLKLLLLSMAAFLL